MLKRLKRSQVDYTFCESVNQKYEEGEHNLMVKFTLCVGGVQASRRAPIGQRRLYMAEPNEGGVRGGVDATLALPLWGEFLVGRHRAPAVPSCDGSLRCSS